VSHYPDARRPGNIPAWTKPYRCKGGFFLRVGPNTQKLSRDEVVRFVLAEGRHRFDEQMNSEFRFETDFNADRLARFLRLADIGHEADAGEILQSLDCARLTPAGLQFRQAGVLFFAKHPQRFIKDRPS